MDRIACPVCGDVHDLSDMQVGFGKPDAYFAVESEERDRRARITEDVAEIDGTHHFIRGVLEIPVRGELQPFGWGIWVEVAAEVYQQYLQAGKDGPSIVAPSTGRVGTQLPGFPQTLGVPVLVQPSADHSLRPTFEVADERHPLGVEQRNGIHVERVLEHLSRYLHAGEPEPRGHPYVATFATDGWQLDDALARFRSRQGVNWLPDAAEREAIRAGEIAKVIFAIEAAAVTGQPEVHRERMWVEVDYVSGAGADSLYTGILTNDPNVPGLTRPGMRVWFRPGHVIDIARADESRSSESRDVLQCARHGVSQKTFVCQHLVKGTGLGFNQAEDPDNPRPDAWCDGCDKVLREEGEWNDRSEAMAKITLMCAECYDAAEARNH